MFLLQWQVFISLFYWIIYRQRLKSQNLEEKGFVMNKACAFLQVCVFVCVWSSWLVTDILCAALCIRQVGKHGQVTDQKKKVSKERHRGLAALNSGPSASIWFCSSELTNLLHFTKWLFGSLDWNVIQFNVVVLNAVSFILKMYASWSLHMLLLNSSVYCRGTLVGSSTLHRAHLTTTVSSSYLWVLYAHAVPPSGQQRAAPILWSAQKQVEFKTDAQ